MWQVPVAWSDTPFRVLAVSHDIKKPPQAEPEGAEEGEGSGSLTAFAAFSSLRLPSQSHLAIYFHRRKGLQLSNIRLLAPALGTYLKVRWFAFRPFSVTYLNKILINCNPLNDHNSNICNKFRCGR